MCDYLPVLDVEKYDQLIEGNRYKIVNKINANVFLDQLREKAIFSPDESEQITNSPQFVTRRAKAGKLHLDATCTKVKRVKRIFVALGKQIYAPQRDHTVCLFIHPSVCLSVRLVPHVIFSLCVLFTWSIVIGS